MPDCGSLFLGGLASAGSGTLRAKVWVNGSSTVYIAEATIASTTIMERFMTFEGRAQDFRVPMPNNGRQRVAVEITFSGGVNFDLRGWCFSQTEQQAQ